MLNLPKITRTETYRDTDEEADRFVRSVQRQLKDDKPIPARRCNYPFNACDICHESWNDDRSGLPPDHEPVVTAQGGA